MQLARVVFSDLKSGLLHLLAYNGTILCVLKFNPTVLNGADYLKCMHRLKPLAHLCGRQAH